jgi:hypothetical protein
MHLDTDLQLDSIHFGRRTLPWSQGPSFWVTGEGDLDGYTTDEDWQVR